MIWDITNMSMQTLFNLVSGVGPVVGLIVWLLLVVLGIGAVLAFYSLVMIGVLALLRPFMKVPGRAPGSGSVPLPFYRYAAGGICGGFHDAGDCGCDGGDCGCDGGC